MELTCTKVGQLDENVYIFYDKDTKDGVIIDPGSESDKVLDIIEKNNINLKGILLTHGHWDHIMGVKQIKDKYNCDIYAHFDERILLTNNKYNFSNMQRNKIEFEADKYVIDNEVLDFGSFSLKCIHTPGHTPGGCCYYHEESKTLFCGDTLFKNGYGRIDLALSTPEIKDSIINKLFILPDDVRAYPGHMDSTTIGVEKKYNPIYSL